MTVVQSSLTYYKKEYVLKVNDKFFAKLDQEKFDYYKEGKVECLDWKWIQLPMKMSGRYLNKLIFSNLSNETVKLQILIHYEMYDAMKLPLTYYSPTREAIIYFDENGYRLFGGVAGSKYKGKFSTKWLDVDKWKEDYPFPMEPLTKQSEGWGIEFTLEIEGNSSSYLYEWDFCKQKLYELEELHTQYQKLLGSH